MNPLNRDILKAALSHIERVETLVLRPLAQQQSSNTGERGADKDISS